MLWLFALQLARSSRRARLYSVVLRSAYLWPQQTPLQSRLCGEMGCGYSIQFFRHAVLIVNFLNVYREYVEGVIKIILNR